MSIHSRALAEDQAWSRDHVHTFKLGHDHVDAITTICTRACARGAKAGFCAQLACIPDTRTSAPWLRASMRSQARAGAHSLTSVHRAQAYAHTYAQACTKLRMHVQGALHHGRRPLPAGPGGAVAPGQAAWP